MWMQRYKLPVSCVRPSGSSRMLQVGSFLVIFRTGDGVVCSDLRNSSHEVTKRNTCVLTSWDSLLRTSVKLMCLGCLEPLWLVSQVEFQEPNTVIALAQTHDSAFRGANCEKVHAYIIIKIAIFLSTCLSSSSVESTWIVLERMVPLDPRTNGLSLFLKNTSSCV